MFAAVVFDLDGTLVDSTAAVERCWRRWADEFGVRLPAVLEHGVPARTGVSRYLPAHRSRPVSPAWNNSRCPTLKESSPCPAPRGAGDRWARTGRHRNVMHRGTGPGAHQRCRYRRTERRDHCRPNHSRQAGPRGIPTGRAPPRGRARLVSCRRGRTQRAGSCHSGRVRDDCAGHDNTTLRRSSLTLVVDSLADVRFETVRDGVRVSIG